MSKNQQKSDVTETVLLRHPLPKYNFQAKKLPKEAPVPLPTNTRGSEHMSKSVLESAKPLIAVQKSIMQAAQQASQDSYLTAESSVTSSLDRKSATVRPLPAAPKLAPFAAGAVKPAVKPTATVQASTVQASHSYTDEAETSVNQLVAAALKKEQESRHVQQAVGSNSVQSQAAAASGHVSGTTGAVAGDTRTVAHGLAPFLPVSTVAATIPVPDAALLAHAIEGPSNAERLQKSQQEVEMLKAQLDIQLQVNVELKRLLVASVGEDLERRMEHLARDRAQLAMELGDFTKKMTEDYENLDQISIQADMWRTKYLASRVMVEELAAGRAFYSAQFHDSQQAMQQMLNERFELRAQMLQAYKCLQQVKEAFDPLNAHKSHGLISTNVFDLGKSIRQLSEAVRFRLLPAHAGSHVMMPLEDSMESTMTKSETFAYELLSQQASPPSFRHSVPGVVTQQTAKSVERFHPQVRQDNLTMNCCAHCKGEIKLA